MHERDQTFKPRFGHISLYGINTKSYIDGAYFFEESLQAFLKVCR